MRYYKVCLIATYSAPDELYNNHINKNNYFCIA